MPNPRKRAARIEARQEVDAAKAKRKAAKNRSNVDVERSKGEKSAAKQLATEEKKNIKASNAAVRNKMLTDKKDARAKRTQKTISTVRSKEKNVNVTGDRRLSGDNTTITKTDNSTTDKSTNVSQEQKQKQKQKQNTNSNNRSSDNRRGDIRQPRPTRPRYIERPTNPKEKKRPRPGDPMPRKQKEDMFKEGRYVPMSRGGITKAKYGKAMKPSMFMSNNDLMQYKKGRVKK